MSAKPNLETVPTAAEILRQAIATRDDFAKQVETIRAKADIFAPIEAEAVAAEAELQIILQADARAMGEWATTGAKGAPPEPQHKAREAATTKVSATRAKLNATGVAKTVFDDEIRQANQNYVQAQELVKMAERTVIAQEMLRSARARHKATIDMLNADTAFAVVHRAAWNAGAGDYYPEEMHKLKRPFTLEDQAAFASEEHERVDQRLAALLRGETPTS